MLRRALKAPACLYVVTSLFIAPGFSQPTTPSHLTAEGASSGQTPALKSEVPQTPSLQQSRAIKQPLTLGAAISIAKKNYPSLRASAAKIAAKQGNILLTKTAYLPRSDFFWQTNWASGQEEVLWKKKVFFKKAVGQDLHENAETRNN